MDGTRYHTSRPKQNVSVFSGKRLLRRGTLEPALGFSTLQILFQIGPYKGEAGRRLLVTGNYCPNQGHVALSFDDLRGSKLTLRDQMDETSYE